MRASMAPRSSTRRAISRPAPARRSSCARPPRPRSSTRQTYNATIDVTAGDFLVAGVLWANLAADVAVTDTLGLTWIASVREDVADPGPCPDGGSGTDGQLWYRADPDDRDDHRDGRADAVDDESDRGRTSSSTRASLPATRSIRTTAAARRSPATGSPPGRSAPPAPTNLAVVLYADDMGFGTIIPDAGWTERGVDTNYLLAVRRQRARHDRAGHTASGVAKQSERRVLGGTRSGIPDVVTACRSRRVSSCFTGGEASRRDPQRRRDRRGAWLRRAADLVAAVAHVLVDRRGRRLVRRPTDLGADHGQERDDRQRRAQGRVRVRHRRRLAARSSATRSTCR